MVSFYGVKSLATRYLQEMYVGLVKMRKKHPRIQLFASALGVFPDSVLMPEAYMMVTSFLNAMLQMLEQDRLLTRINSSSFFDKYSQLNRVFVPLTYLRRAAAVAHKDDENVCKSVVDFAESAASDTPLATEADCVKYAAKGLLTKKAVVIGAAVEEPQFVDGDLFLHSLGNLYNTMLESRHQKVDDALIKNGTAANSEGDSTHLSLDDFKIVLAEVRDLDAHPMSADAQEEMYHQLDVGNGMIRHDDLKQMLDVIELRDSAETMQPSNLEVVAKDERESKTELRELTRGWDQMRMSITEVPLEDERIQHFQEHATLVTRIQKKWLQQLCRIRSRREQLAAESEHHMGVGGRRRGSALARWK